MEELNPAEFSAAHARHLLRRTVIGPTYEECIRAATSGLQATLDMLLQPHAVGTEGIDHLLGKEVMSDMHPYDSQEYLDFFDEKNARYIDTIQWWQKSIVRSPTSIQERMVLFWHSLVPVSFNGSQYAEHVVDYLLIVREHALGNVRDILRNVSMSLAMQFFLDDTINEWHPWFDGVNENHAREMLELHFMGRQDRYGNPNYTQAEVADLARALSGWRLNYRWEETGKPGIRMMMNTRYASWKEDHWDPRPKTLFGKTAAFDTPKAIDHILTVCQDKIAWHICKKLYYEFVNHEIDDDVVAELARHMVEHSMEIQPTLRMLFSSRHFYDQRHHMSLVQSPTRYVLGLLRTTTVDFVPDFDPARGRKDPDLVMRMRAFGHSLGQPPNVSGWVSGPDWLSAPSVIRRITFGQKFARGTIIAMDFATGLHCHTFDVARFMRSITPDLDPDHLATELCTHFLETDAPDVVQLVSRALGSANAGTWAQREALAQIFQSFRAQLH